MENKKINLLAFLFLCVIIFLFGCAEKKNININGKNVLIEPYGWMDKDSKKNDSVVYKMSTGNIVWSVILCETIVAPIILTGTALYEPVRKK